MNRLCTICARGGSKGVKGKNLRTLLGKPLIAHSIEQARASGLFSRIAVSSDSDAILDVAREYGVDDLVKRPDDLATDQAAKLPVIRHCVAEVETATASQFPVIVDLDATSPLRSLQDIVDAVSLLEGSDADNVITGMPSRRSPYFNLVELDANGVARLSKAPASPIVRRQDAPACFDMNASIYVWRREVLFNAPTLFNARTRLLAMPESRSIDIDTEIDFRLVELLMQEAVRSNESDR